jgi:hypothetical protein
MNVRRALLIIFALLLLPATALASGGAQAAVQDCQDGRIDGTYTAAEYRNALRAIPTDVDEYTNCRDLLRAAQLAAAGTTPSGSGTPAGARGSARSAPGGPAAPGAPVGGAPTPGDAGGPASAGGLSSGSAAPAGAPSPAAAPPPGSAPGAAPPPRIAGLPTLGSASPVPPPTVPLADVSRATERIPPRVAIVLLVLGGGLLTAALVARRPRAGT